MITVFFWCSVALAASTVVLHLVVPLQVIDLNALAGWMRSHSMGGLANVDGGILRIYFRSQVLLIPALLIGMQRLVTHRQHRLALLSASSVIGMSLLLSLTRALWLGFAMALLVLCACRTRKALPLLRQVGLVLVGMACLMMLSVAAYRGPALVTATAERLSPNLIVVAPTNPAPAPAPNSVEQPSGSMTTRAPRDVPNRPSSVSPQPPSSVDSDADAVAVNVRSRTLELSKEKIKERPLTGWGLGYNLDAIRHDGRTEYMYWDLLMKLGFLGLALLLVVYGWPPVATLVSDIRGESLGVSAALAAALAGCAVASYFNPFLNSTLGIVILLMLIAATGGGVPRRAGRPGSSSENA